MPLFGGRTFGAGVFVSRMSFVLLHFKFRGARYSRTNGRKEVSASVVKATRITKHSLIFFWIEQELMSMNVD